MRFDVSVLALALVGAAAAQVPNRVSFQGRLEDPPGTPLTGAHILEVTLHGDEHLDDPVANEARPITFGADGTFESDVTVSGADLQRPLWAEVSVDMSPPTTPRIAVDPAPQALVAQVAEGLVVVDAQADTLQALPSPPASILSELLPRAGRYMVVASLGVEATGGTGRASFQLYDSSGPLAHSQRGLTLQSGESGAMTIVDFVDSPGGESVLLLGGSVPADSLAATYRTLVAIRVGP